MLNLTNDELLSTTRAVRKRLDFDKPVEMDVIKQCVELAMQAPSGSNSQSWRFLLLTDVDKKRQIANLYRKAFAVYREGPTAPTQQHKDDPSMAKTQQRVLESAAYLAENLERAPVWLIPCMNGRFDAPGMATRAAAMFGSVIPAAWSFMLAARARGLGTCWTTLHLGFEKESAQILGIPYDNTTQVALIPIAYTKGTDFKPAARKPLESFLYINSWPL